MLPFAYAARNVLRDPLGLAQKAGGACLVVSLVFAAGAFQRGMEGVLRGTGSPRNAILLGAGSEESVERSEVAMRAETLAAAGIRGIEKRLGQLSVSGEVHCMGLLTVPGSGEARVLLRGVTPAAFEVHRQARVTHGAYPHPGEVLVGRLAHRAMGVSEEALAPGGMVRFEGRDFLIAGEFEAPGTVMESEVWMERTDLMALIQRDALSCVVVRLERAEDFAEAELFCKQRLDLELTALRETEYYGNLARFYEPLRAMTWLTAGLVAAGAIFGGLNMLYAAFASRVRELGTLQAVGFSRLTILGSLVQESLLSTLLGTLLAALLSVILLDGATVAFSMGTFRMALTPEVLGWGLATGLALGSLGALPPALRCLQAPIPEALKSA